jgi:hypothetical protein
LTRIRPRLVFAVETTVPAVAAAWVFGGLSRKIAAASAARAAAAAISQVVRAGAVR